ncbi:magnesium transporter CorA family protein [Fictibacillus barbaricus]|uniref:Magnesium transporter CorA family protein n=2 Tax=Fictibacillus barbaricus TaxID=182136 RepID=A0ABS2Z9A0_9BACL|nr:magnesium transporter CorA family protein [Fictibacillus barbaricus]MBN3543996.1 magnesium transporter CorA family protein [Fictibacillus barbaricus]GGB70259.1 magnesium transport protein CorA [Fictibacillus barbaricus]
MMEQTSVYGWTWYRHEYHNETLNQLIADNKGCEKWLENIKENKSNYLRIERDRDGDQIVRGSLTYKQDPKNQSDYEIFHFYLRPKSLVTVGLDLSSIEGDYRDPCDHLIIEEKTPVEGFLILLGELINHFLDGIDELEFKLKELQRDVQRNNHTTLLNSIYDRRIELINWSDLTLPVHEAQMAIKEAFLDEITETPAYKRIETRIDRTITLLSHYRQDIDTLLNLEEVLSSHRGNEIMKTLTVFTVIFTPAMGLGAIWGMNFKNMPELDWKLGYLYAMILIVGSTLGVYLWLRMKGWTGDLLRGKKNSKHFD